MVELSGVEPESRVCQTRVFPLDDSPMQRSALPVTPGTKGPLYR